MYVRMSALTRHSTQSKYVFYYCPSLKNVSAQITSLHSPHTTLTKAILIPRPHQVCRYMTMSARVETTILNEACGLFFFIAALLRSPSQLLPTTHTVQHTVDGQACPIAYRRPAGKPCDYVIQELALTMSHQQTTCMLTNL